MFLQRAFKDRTMSFHVKNEFQSSKYNISFLQYILAAGERFMKFLRTWVEGLDEMLGGGIPEKSVVLMIGEPGSGYDILAQQILYQNALQNGKAAYFSTSRVSDALKEDFETFGWNVSPLQEKDNWQFFQVNVPNVIQVLTETIPRVVAQGRWVLIDSLSYLILTQKYRDVIRVVELLLNAARQHGGVHFLLLTQKMHDAETETTMQHLVDGVMEFSAQEMAGGIDRRIRMKKMRRAVYEPRLIPFNITERGITIETAVRIA
jgi:KaiC/GvpD/RAD55 family RecA-like ATPase